MNIEFSKYQGCGNDFVLMDNRKGRLNLMTQEINRICDRRFGVGADGLILLGASKTGDFSMTYFNSDGNESSFCGNGGRCIVQFAKDIGLIRGKSTSFSFSNEIYNADILDNDLISLHMTDIDDIKQNREDLVLDTGSPHYIYFVDDVEGFDLIPYAKKIRYSADFPDGINVNIVKILGTNSIEMRTYERGVEDETYSCGTGVTAAVIAYNKIAKSEFNQCNVKTKGGNFMVSFEVANNLYTSIRLIAPSEMVFKGTIDL